MKLCVDCKHHKVTRTSPIMGANPPKMYDQHECFHPDVRFVMSVVTGESHESTMDCECSTVRSILKGIYSHEPQGKCGREGNLWEPVPKNIPAELSKGLYLSK